MLMSWSLSRDKNPLFEKTVTNLYTCMNQSHRFPC